MRQAVTLYSRVCTVSDQQHTLRSGKVTQPVRDTADHIPGADVCLAFTAMQVLSTAYHLCGAFAAASLQTQPGWSALSLAGTQLPQAWATRSCGTC